MKKALFSILTVGALLASCTTFDEPTAKKFGEGPSIEVSEPVISDNTFTFTVTPAEGSNYYTYAVVESDEIEEIDGESLLKDQVESLVSSVNKVTEDKKSATENMVGADGSPLCDPNTSYVIYAVAADANGIPGKVTAVKVTTSDGVCPEFKIEDAQKSGNSYVLPFSENVSLGSGKISACYFVEWGTEPFVEIPAEDITVEVNGSNVAFTVDGVPANCYVFISFEAGAFVDGKGNNCDALVSGFNESMTGFTGCYFQMEAGELPISLDNVASPAPGKISDWTMPIELEFDEAIFANPEAESCIEVIYKGAIKSTSIKISEWEVDDNTLTFNLPEPPANGDVISFVIGEEIISDVYGNFNAETALADVYVYDVTKWNLVGVGTYTYFPFFGEEDGSGAPDPEQELYVSESDPNMYKFTNWGGGVDFVFEVGEDGLISWEPFACYDYTGYGPVVAYNIGAMGAEYPQSYYDAETGVFHFQIDYYLEAADYDWYDFENDETFVLNPAEAKARGVKNSFAKKAKKMSYNAIKLKK